MTSLSAFEADSGLVNYSSDSSLETPPASLFQITDIYRNTNSDDNLYYTPVSYKRQKRKANINDIQQKRLQLATDFTLKTKCNSQLLQRMIEDKKLAIKVMNEELEHKELHLILKAEYNKHNILSKTLSEKIEELQLKLHDMQLHKNESEMKDICTKRNDEILHDNHPQIELKLESESETRHSMSSSWLSSWSASSIHSPSIVSKRISENENTTLVIESPVQKVINVMSTLVLGKRSISMNEWMQNYRYQQLIKVENQCKMRTQLLLESLKALKVCKLQSSAPYFLVNVCSKEEIEKSLALMKLDIQRFFKSKKFKHNGKVCAKDLEYILGTFVEQSGFKYLQGMNSLAFTLFYISFLFLAIFLIICK